MCTPSTMYIYVGTCTLYNMHYDLLWRMCLKMVLALHHLVSASGLEDVPAILTSLSVIVHVCIIQLYAVIVYAALTCTHICGPQHYIHVANIFVRSGS